MSFIKSDSGFYYGITDRIFKSVIFKYDIRLTKWFIDKILYDIYNYKLNDFRLIDVVDSVINKDDKEREFDFVAYIDDKYFLNIEANSKYDGITHYKNFAYLASLYLQTTKRGSEYSRKKILAVDITSGLSGEYSNMCEHESFLVQNDKGIEYVRNIEKVVYNVDKIMNGWYTKDEKIIKKYAHIMMLKMDEVELKELLTYLGGIDEYYVRIFTERMIVMNEDFTFIKPFTKEEEIEIEKNTMKTLGHEKGVEEGEKKHKLKLLRIWQKIILSLV